MYYKKGEVKREARQIWLRRESCNGALSCIEDNLIGDHGRKTSARSVSPSRRGIRIPLAKCSNATKQ
jgi:hypothetical protein